MTTQTNEQIESAPCHRIRADEAGHVQSALNRPHPLPLPKGEGRGEGERGERLPGGIVNKPGSLHDVNHLARAALRSGKVRLTLNAPANIRRVLRPDGVCVLTFDRPDSAANVFDRATLAELDAQLAFIENQPDVQGVVLASAKPSIFIAGADLHALGKFPSTPGTVPPDLPALIELGQRVFNRLAALSVPTVAAIHGACVGGGFELALACDYRVASPDKATKIGLPETQLGILPAWGGSTRLPRLIGLPLALDVILGGKTLPAKVALKRGMVDELAPKQQLVDLAVQRILGGSATPRRTAHALTNNALSAAVIAARARSQVWQRTRGHYPAVLKALDVAVSGLRKSVSGSLALEREAVLELAQSEAARNLIRVFFLQERAKKLGTGQASSLALHSSEKHGKASETGWKPVLRATVIGAGVMGAGIAQWLTSRGVQVTMTDIDTDAVARGVAKVAELYRAGAKRRVFTPVEMRQGMDRLTPFTGEPPLRHMDLVIEAAVERMDLKKRIFQGLAARSSPDTILATNTSALSVAGLADATPCPERVIGIHFFNPVHKMQLVEVVRGPRTSPDVVARAVRFVQQTGRLPVLVNDSPGFVVNRILMPYLLEAGHLFEHGARIEDIDAAMLDFGMPMGPLRLVDEVGVDVAAHVARTLVEQFSPRLRMPMILEKMLQAGQLGRKADHGFYLHNTKRPVPHTELAMFRVAEDSAGLDRNVLQEGMVMLMVNEAARCLEEGVVGTPADVDFAMIMGTGFAPFRGGPLRHADALGVQHVVERMNRLAATSGERFHPCALLEQMAEEGRRFYEG
jgi:3-hydroxyacyl-CoA dehydrogenase / enoyl-CoA hydratase / 3-hydroxybutyryl-CoA epimerase